MQGRLPGTPAPQHHRRVPGGARAPSPGQPLEAQPGPWPARAGSPGRDCARGGGAMDGGSTPRDRSFGPQIGDRLPSAGCWGGPLQPSPRPLPACPARAMNLGTTVFQSSPVAGRGETGIKAEVSKARAPARKRPEGREGQPGRWRQVALWVGARDGAPCAPPRAPRGGGFAANRTCRTAHRATDPQEG